METLPLLNPPFYFMMASAILIGVGFFIDSVLVGIINILIRWWFRIMGILGSTENANRF